MLHASREGSLPPEEERQDVWESESLNVREFVCVCEREKERVSERVRG